MWKPHEKILVRRTGALGDVLLTTPVVHRLRNELGPGAIIDVETACPQAYEGNPHVNKLHVHVRDNKDYDKVYDLNLVYERSPKQHIVDSYFQHVFGDTNGAKRVVFGIDPPPPRKLAKASKVVTLHATRSWPSRTLPESFWNDVALKLIDTGYQPVFLGGGGDYGGPDHPQSVSMVNRTPLRETVNLIAASCCFIGSDSALLHFAGATDVPIVGIFTSVKSQYRMPYRKNILGWLAFAAEPKLSCYGCLEDVPAPATTLGCKFNTNECTQVIYAADVISKALFLMEQV